MKIVGSDYLVIIRKAGKPNTEIKVPSLDSAKVWYKVFARNHDHQHLQIIRRHYYEFDEIIHFEEAKD